MGVLEVFGGPFKDSDQENAQEQREENERVLNETNEYARFIDELIKIFGSGQETVSQDTDDITTSSRFNDVLKNEKGEEADLYDMLVIDKKGVMSVDPRVANFNRLDFIGLVQGLSRRTNQTKGKMHSPMISRRAYGKLLMLFRSWLLPGIRRRYGHGGGSTLRVDEELGAVTQGMYIRFWNLLT